jgi:Gas vesicle synthesis protein GvpL/GvpF
VGTYVYCVGSAESFGPERPALQSRGVGGPDVQVRTVEYGGLAAVVSDAQATVYDITRDNLMAHQRVVEESMRHSDVLPVAFGTVARDDRDVRDKLLRREHDQLHEHLAYIRGRVELGLKVLWDRERLFSEIVAERDDIRSLRDRIASRPPDSAYFERIQLGELTEAAIGDKRERDGDALLEALLPLAVDSRLNGLLTDMMVLNASFLVDRDRIEAFDARVQRLGEIHADRLVFQYVGPLPAYSFVNISVSWED